MHLRNIKKYKDTISLYTPIGEDKEGNEIKICDVIIDPSPSMTDNLIKMEHYENLKQALSELNTQELEIISRRFGLNNYQVETQRDIAKSLGISRSYVSRIEKRALTKLYLKLKD
jgi:RNA polymerase sporulation-specific sigma factor